jgi:O-acetyl-ADP-ribose deacetylase (regulator of RNase III)
VRFAVLGGDVLDSAVEHGDRDLGAGLWVIRERGLGSVAVPALGVGNGGLDWADVSRSFTGSSAG